MSDVNIPLVETIERLKHPFFKEFSYMNAAQLAFYFKTGQSSGYFEQLPDMGALPLVDEDTRREFIQEYVLSQAPPIVRNHFREYLDLWVMNEAA